MKNTKKIRLVIEGFVPEDFPVENLTTAGGVYPDYVTEWRPLYVHADIGGEYGADYTSVLEGHMTVSAEVVVPPEPEYKTGQLWQSASGDVYRRTGVGNWEAFGVAGTIAHTWPARPMKLEIDVRD